MTLGDALVRASRYLRLVTPNVELSFYVEGSRAVVLCKGLNAAPARRDRSELTLAALGKIARRLTGTPLSPLEVRLTRDAPPDPAHLQRLFETTAIYFSRPHDGYVFDSGLLNLPIRGENSRPCDELEHEAEALLAKMPKTGGLSWNVQETITEELQGGNPSAEHVAGRLGLHPKTLTRRLKAEGTTHRQLLDQLRYRLAERYLRQPNLSIGQIAFLVGFTDASSFNKAFRRWTGEAPRHYRAELARVTEASPG
jgi:AraC-like DNA-binding protein